MTLIQSILDFFERMASQTDPVFAAALLLVVMALSLVGMSLYVVLAAIRKRKE